MAISCLFSRSDKRALSRMVLSLLALSLSSCAAHATTAKAPAAKPQAASEPAANPAPVTVTPEASTEGPAPAATTTRAEVMPGADAADREGVLGVIERAGLVEIVDAGLGRVFQRLKVSPVLNKGRFVGFQITSLHPDWSAAAIQTGDVITALNGMAIERPEQAMAAFESLREADQMVISLLRAGAPVTLRYRIE